MSLSFRRYGVMDFTERNPDRPQIAGMLPGPNDTLPFSPEERPNTSGIKTRTPNGPREAYNEFSFDDSPGRQNINIQAQNSMNISVKGDARSTVTGDMTHNIEGDHTHSAHDSIIYSAKDKMTLHVGDTKIEMEPRKMSITTFRFATGMPPEPTDPLPEKVPTFTSAPGSEQTADMQTPQKQQSADSLFYPSAKLSIDLGQVALPPQSVPPFICEIVMNMNANLTADSESGMTEIDYQAAESKIKTNLKANVADLFEEMKVIRIDLEKKVMQINVEHIGTLTSTSFTLKGNQVSAEFTDNGVKTTYRDWKFAGSVTLNLTVTMIPNQPKQSKESVYQEVKQHLEENLLIGLVITESLFFDSSLKTHHAAIGQKSIAPPSSLRDKIIAATVIVTMMLLAPAGV